VDADELAGVLRGAEEVGVDDPGAGRSGCSHAGVDASRCGVVASRVVVECERDVLDAKVGELLEEMALDGCPAKGGDAAELVCAEDVDVQYALDE
jgi:hypothetical protein